MDATHIRIRGQWCYLDRAMDRMGETIGFLLTEQRDERAALRFLTIAIRQMKYLNNIVEQDSRAVKRVTRPMPGFKSLPGGPVHTNKN